MLPHTVAAAEPRPVPLPLSAFETADLTVDVLSVRSGRHESSQICGTSELFAEFQRRPLVSSPLSHRDSVTFGSLHFKAFFTPGHTVGHMVYLLDGKPTGSPCSLFSGDLVFLAGCGTLAMNTVKGKLSYR